MGILVGLLRFLVWCVGFNLCFGRRHLSPGGIQESTVDDINPALPITRNISLFP